MKRGAWYAFAVFLGLLLAAIALVFLYGCSTSHRPPPPPTPAAPIAFFEKSCRDIWEQELHRVIDPDGLAGCVAAFLGGATGESVRAGVQASPEWLEAHKPHVGRRGQVRADRFALIDDEGPRLFLGTSLFWALWGELHDRDRLEQNLKAAAEAGVDYIRVFAQVGGDSWADRAVDPSDPGWQDAIRTLTDRAYDKYGLRVQWTVFAWATHLTAAQRQAALDRLLDVVDIRREKVFAIEIANEGFANGPEPAEAKALAARARARFPGFVATTAPRGDSCDAQAPWYRNSAASLVTLHLDRDVKGAGGLWRPVRQPWRESTFSCPGQPQAYASNEPIGPQSSVAEDDDPLRLVAQGQTTWIAGMGAFLFHTGAGIRGGGAADRAKGRVANLWEVAHWSETTAGLRAVRAALQADLPNWSRGTSKPSMFTVDVLTGPSNPKAGADRVYCAESGGRFVCSAFNIKTPTTLTAKRAMHVRVVHPLTGATVAEGNLSKGGTLRLETTPAAVLVIGQ